MIYILIGKSRSTVCKELNKNCIEKKGKVSSWIYTVEKSRTVSFELNPVLVVGTSMPPMGNLIRAFSQILLN